MSGELDLEKVLSEMHSALAQELLDDIRSGDASAQTLNVARQFLKDNGISGIATKGSPLAGLLEEIPDMPDVYYLTGKG